VGADDVLAMIRSGRLRGTPIDGVWHVRASDVAMIVSVLGKAPSDLTPLEAVRAILAPRGHRVPQVNLDEYEPDPSVARVLDGPTCSRLCVFPVSRAGSSLILAMANPEDVGAIDEVKFLTGFDVEAVHATKEAIAAAIVRQHGKATST
jgi:hypothetical protein